MKKLLCILLILMLAGCKQVEVNEPIEIEHKLGTTQVTKNPKKVIVFDMGILEIMDALDLEIGGVPKASLTTSLQKYSEDKYLDAGTLFEPDFEQLATYGPELIIISGRASKHYDALSEIAPTIYLGTGVSDNGLIASIEENVHDLKQLYPHHDFDKLMETMYASVNEISEVAKNLKAKTLFLLANGDSISSYGLGSRYDHLFNEFGFTPVSNDFTEATHGDSLSFELVAKLNPDIIVVMDRGAIAGSDMSAQELLDNDFVKMTNAYKQDRIIYVNPELWYLTEGGILAITNASKELLNGLD